MKKYIVCYLENGKLTQISFSSQVSAMQYLWSCQEIGLPASLHEAEDEPIEADKAINSEVERLYPSRIDN